MRGLMLGTSFPSKNYRPPVAAIDGFTPQSSVELDVLMTSSGVQVTSLPLDGAAVSISGSGSPQWQSASDASFTSIVQDWTSLPGIIALNHYVRVRLTSPTLHLTERTATLVVGSVNAQFVVTTRAMIHVYLTTPGAGNWIVPANWYSGNNYIECVGPGGSGQQAIAQDTGGAGGGGGGYCRKNNYVLTPGVSISYTVGVSGSNTSFNSDAFGATSGTHGFSVSNAPAPGGMGYGGDINTSGGDGAGHIPNGSGGGSGGGHAGRPNGNGLPGSGPIAFLNGGPGGGPNEGAGGPNGCNNGGPGGSTAEDTGVDTGGGGGGGGYCTGTSGSNGGNGGLYGGGGGGAGYRPGFGGAQAGAGAQGVIHIVY